MIITRIALTDANEQTLVAAPGSGQRIRVYFLTGSNGGASESRVDIKDGTTAKLSYHLASAGGGFVASLPSPHHWDLTVATALKVQQSAAVTSWVSVGYEVI
jgi:hypothetical protein